MQLIVKGTISGKKQSTYEGKISYRYQFLQNTGEELKIIEVKSDLDLFNINDNVNWEVTVSCYKDVIHYKLLAPVSNKTDK